MNESWELSERRFALTLPESKGNAPIPQRPAITNNSMDLHAWSLYRQNLNSDFTDSALDNQDRNPLPYGNFQLRETIVQNILSNPRYAPKSEFGSNMHNYLKFGLPRVLPPLAPREGSSGYDSSDDGGGRRRRTSPGGWNKSKSNPDLLAPNRDIASPLNEGKRMKSSSEANLLGADPTYHGKRASKGGINRRMGGSQHSLASRRSRHNQFVFNQPPDSSNAHREPPILNDKLFPRDVPWDDIPVGAVGGVRAPHLQLRGVVVEAKAHSGAGWTPLLDTISIEARGGELFAIMATSESEGTCLLDLIGGGKPSAWGRWRGDFILNGNLVPPHKVWRRCAYVRQDVNFCPDMSVRQTMLLHSSLRECSDASRIANIKAKINGLIEDLGLEQVCHTRVKDITLSERRRLNVACHLLLETDIIVLDQPTKGMDIFDTFFLVEYLRQWAARGRIVIATLHPPTFEIFLMLSRVALISTGRLMYFGPRREMLPYFAFIDYPCPAFKNPSDYYIDLVTLDDLTPEAMLESSQVIEMLADTFRRRQQPLSDPGPSLTLPPKVKKSNVCIQLLFLWIRAMIYQFPYNMLHFLGQSVVAALISSVVGAVYLNLRDPTKMDQSNINDRVAFYYVLSCVAVWPLVLLAGAEAWRDRPAVERDISDGLYSRSIYVFTKICYSFPTAVLVYVAYALPAYSLMAGLSGGGADEGQLYAFVGYEVLLLLAMRAVALAAAVCFDSRHVAAAITTLVLAVAALGSGFTVHPKDITWWAAPTLWWSPSRWFLREMVSMELNRTSVTFSCARNPVHRGDIVKKIECGVETGEQAVRFLGLSEEPVSHVAFPALFIIAFNLFFTLIYILGFILGRKPKRSKKYKIE